MNERAKLLKVVACIVSFITVLSIMFIIIICIKDGFIIYPYICVLIPVICCIRLWKMYRDEKKQSALSKGKEVNY